MTQINKPTKPLPFKQIQETKWEKWRAETFWTKEPETLKWIESFEPRSFFVDVGANIGQYSLYAASFGHYVFSYEPQPANYQSLLRNIGLNKFFDLITAYPFALAEKQKITSIELSSRDTAGKSGLQFQKHGSYFVLCMTLEPRYDYVKIDVDGIELEIVRGMNFDVPLPNIPKSVLIEVSPDNQEEIFDIFQEHGFKIDQRFEPESIENHSTNHREASGSPVRNIVFTRNL